jgi:hypothetical protein
MNRLEPLDAEELERLAREQYARAFPKRPASVTRARNVRATLLIVGDGKVEFAFHGRMYEVLPVSFEDGCRLQDVQATLGELAETGSTGGANGGPETIERSLHAFRFIAGLARRYVRPRGKWRRLLWTVRLTRNPFRRATPAEVGELLGFFLGCQMRSSVRYLGT